MYEVHVGPVLVGRLFRRICVISHPMLKNCFRLRSPSLTYLQQFYLFVMNPKFKSYIGFIHVHAGTGGIMTLVGT